MIIEISDDETSEADEAGLTGHNAAAPAISSPPQEQSTPGDSSKPYIIIDLTIEWPPLDSWPEPSLTTIATLQAPRGRNNF
jgi:hypothetical protein